MKFEDIVYTFLKELAQFEYDVSYSDTIWDLIFPDNKDKWSHLRITKYKNTFYMFHIDGNNCDLEIIPQKSVNRMKSFGFSSYEAGINDPGSVWTPMLSSARAWLKKVKKGWIKTNARVQKEYPLNRRFGIAPNSLVRASLKDIYRLDLALGKMKCKKFIRLVENGYFNKDENFIIESMSAKNFFDYCRIAYIAGKRKDESVDENLSGREMYERYADGRHEGLLDIDENSKQDFADWIDGKHPKKNTGGHPWEIKRGGNTTHINLSVFHPSVYRENGFKIELRGAAVTRLVETVKIFLALFDASLPISIADPDGIRKRLIAQDNIGIVPCFSTLHRANQHFKEDQNVYDVLYYDDLGRYKRRITPFITWEPLPVFKHRD